MPKQKKAELVDWYKKIPERFLTKSHNPHYDTHHIKIPFRMLIIGSSGSGKTQTLLSLIYNMPDTFESIIITTKNKDEPLYNYMDERYGKKGIKIQEIDKDGLPDLDKFDKTQQTLLIMDDLVGEKNQKPMEQYFIRARKKNCSLIYISQSYYAVPKMIRNNLTYLIIKQVSSMKNLLMISREYDLGIDKKLLTDMYRNATKDKQGFLLIDLEGDPNERFRKNFDEYYDVDGESDTEGEKSKDDLSIMKK
jgi:ABC-type dipeptide/oligopeptide/nickel transport system ATPase component